MTDVNVSDVIGLVGVTNLLEHHLYEAETAISFEQGFIGRREYADKLVLVDQRDLAMMLAKQARSFSYTALSRVKPSGGSSGASIGHTVSVCGRRMLLSRNGRSQY